MGALSAEPRRAHARDGHRRRARLHVSGVQHGPAGAAQSSASAGVWRRSWATAGTGSSCWSACSSRFPGTPIIYYGDEIGMGDNLYLGDRNGVRTPMQWTGDRNAGFSRADPARLYSPVVMDPVYGYQAVNVEAQESDAASLLHWMRNMIRLRKQFKVFGRGHDGVPVAGQRQGARVRSPVPRRRDSLRRQPVAHGAAGGARSARLRRPDAGGDAGVHGIPDDRRSRRIF